jgi:hypothetical protein
MYHLSLLFDVATIGLEPYLKNGGNIDKNS